MYFNIIKLYVLHLEKKKRIKYIGQQNGTDAPLIE